MLSRKASAPGVVLPVPETDTGGQVENTKAIEIIIVKELGKMPRNFGRRGAWTLKHSCSVEGVRAAETRGRRLFIKNTGACEVVRRCICTDSCPVLEG